MNSSSSYHSRRQTGYPEAPKDYSTRPLVRYRAVSVDPLRSSFPQFYRNDLNFPISSSSCQPPALLHHHPISYRGSSHCYSSVNAMSNRSALFLPPSASTPGSRYRTTERSTFISSRPSLSRSSSLSKFAQQQAPPTPHTFPYNDSRSLSNYFTEYSNSNYSNNHRFKYSYSLLPSQMSRRNGSPVKRASYEEVKNFSHLSVCPSPDYSGTDTDFRSPPYPSGRNPRRINGRSEEWAELHPRRVHHVEVETGNEETPKTKSTAAGISADCDSADIRVDRAVAVTVEAKTVSRSSSGRSTSPTDVNLNNTTPPTSSASASTSSDAYRRKSSGLHGGRAITTITTSSTASISSSSSSNAVGINSSSASPTSTAGLIGLSNLGNTCFMNSVIQCLSNTRELLCVCLDYVYQSELNVNSSMKGNLFTAYADLMRQMWTPSSSTIAYVSPQRFRSQVQKFAPRFMGYAQQDAQEFLRYLVQGLHEDVNRVTKRPPSEIPDYDKEDRMPDSKKAALYWQRYKRIDDSIIADLFLGQLMSTLECMSCGHKSTTFDPFWDLSLPIPRGSEVDIHNCFDLFTSNEILDGAEQPTCSGCKRRQPCRKSFSIQRFPKILVIHFKRFSGERSRSKLTTFIDYPIEHLDLNRYAAYCSPETNASYRLYAVSNHSGSVFGGHYTASCLHPKLGTWFEFNDTRVRPIRKTEAVSSEAYVLFYQRNDGRSA
ncbi:ubiquitin specific protease 41 [Echinococcus multilocularis]|uniref:Ubiquitin carboxyl-terminal hydrolase n=1 Tax=Echinococcus multilocularis TaxID=6211 RepID=A0A068YBQ8_ECHMU|nr:ubiquitin specific protease 41 [Echinococcus multilocularis]